MLVLAPFGRDAGVISGALREAALDAREQSSLPELVRNLEGAAAAVIAEEALVHEHRGGLAEWIAGQPPWSDFPFVLLTLRTGQYGPALAESIGLLGNVTVLERPLAATSLKARFGRPCAVACGSAKPARNALGAKALDWDLMCILAALSGPNSKAPGFAGGYLLGPEGAQRHSGWRAERTAKPMGCFLLQVTHWAEDLRQFG